MLAPEAAQAADAVAANNGPAGMVATTATPEVPAAFVESPRDVQPANAHAETGPERSMAAANADSAAAPGIDSSVHPEPLAADPPVDIAPVSSVEAVAAATDAKSPGLFDALPRQPGHEEDADPVNQDVTPAEAAAEAIASGDENPTDDAARNA